MAAKRSGWVQTEFISRKDVKYFIVFSAGIIGAFLAGQLSAAAASFMTAQTYLLPGGGQGYTANNIAVFILTLVFYAAGGLLTMFVAGWLGARHKLANFTLGTLSIFVLFLLLLIVDVAYSPWNLPNMIVWKDLLTIIASGSIYVVGWWAAQRYTR